MTRNRRYVSYKEMYLKMARASKDATTAYEIASKALISALRECEDMYIEGCERPRRIIRTKPKREIPDEPPKNIEP